MQCSSKHTDRNAEEGERNTETEANIMKPTQTSSSQQLSNPLSNGDDSASSTSSLSLFDGESSHWNLDGALYRIMEYLKPSDFYTLGALTGSRFWREFLFENPHAEYLFAPPGKNQRKTKGRTHLKNIYYLRKSITRQKKRKRKGSHQQVEKQSLNRVGVFSPQEENSILCSDEANGYFGVSFLRSGVLAVWGDYSGLYLTSRMDRHFSSDKPPESQLDAATMPCQMGDLANGTTESTMSDNKVEKVNVPSVQAPTDKEREEDDGWGYLFADSYQVMAILFSTPYVFIGFASGSVRSIDSRPVYMEDPESSPEEDPTKAESRKSVEYPLVSECKFHWQRGEISSLTSIKNRHLASSSMRFNAMTSEILIHWNALEDGNLQRISKIKIDFSTFDDRALRANANPHPIFDVSPLAMASPSSPDTYMGQSCVNLSIGARGQNIAHLRFDDIPSIGESNNTFVGDSSVYMPYKAVSSDTFHTGLRAYRLRRMSDRSSHHFVFLKYFQETRLIVGTSKGDLIKLKFGYKKEDHYKEKRLVLYNCCKGGMVEAVELVGNKHPIMITAGGCDGRVRFWDFETFESLGSLRVHPGQQSLVAEAGLASRMLPISHLRHSPVVSTFFCHERSSLVSFCRDGHLHEWKVEEQAKEEMIAAATTAATAVLPTQKCSAPIRVKTEEWIQSHTPIGMAASPRVKAALKKIADHNHVGFNTISDGARRSRTRRRPKRFL